MWTDHARDGVIIHSISAVVQLYGLHNGPHQKWCVGCVSVDHVRDGVKSGMKNLSFPSSIGNPGGNSSCVFWEQKLTGHTVYETPSVLWTQSVQEKAGRLETLGVKKRFVFASSVSDHTKSDKDDVSG